MSFPVVAKGTLVCRKMEKRCDISSQVETISQKISKALRKHHTKLSHTQYLCRLWWSVINEVLCEIVQIQGLGVGVVKSPAHGGREETKDATTRSRLKETALGLVCVFCSRCNSRVVEVD